uniref:Uncharacterized protein n=1 Tax=Romanomermis culicivorax TaxID=13658 RepID=A0A915IJ52_ROMCU
MIKSIDPFGMECWFHRTCLNPLRIQLRDYSGKNIMLECFTKDMDDKTKLMWNKQSVFENGNH